VNAFLSSLFAMDHLVQPVIFSGISPHITAGLGASHFIDMVDSKGLHKKGPDGTGFLRPDKKPDMKKEASKTFLPPRNGHAVADDRLSSLVAAWPSDDDDDDDDIDDDDDDSDDLILGDEDELDDADLEEVADVEIDDDMDDIDDDDLVLDANEDDEDDEDE
jgi:hypothetical protein